MARRRRTLRRRPQKCTAATIDVIGDDLLQNIVARLPAKSFASAACVSRSWKAVCDRVLCRPKLASACSFNPSFEDGVKEVLDKLLSEPIRPHFAIASIGNAGEHDADFSELSYLLDKAHQLITAALGSKVPVVTHTIRGLIGRDAISDEHEKIEWVCGDYEYAILLVIGFLPGLKVTTIPLLQEIQDPRIVMIDNFVTDIREFSTSVSGCNSPSAIIMFSEDYKPMPALMEKLDYAMSPETVIVGDPFSNFRCAKYTPWGNIDTIALIFAVDKNKSPGETQFHAVLSSGLSPVGPTYKAESVVEKDYANTTSFAVKREGSHENIDGETLLNQVFDQIGYRTRFHNLFIGVTKERKCSIGDEKARCISSLAFHQVKGIGEGLSVYGLDIKFTDTFRFYLKDVDTALSSQDAVSSHLRSFNKREVFGGLIFTCLSIKGANIGSPILDNFPGATVGGTFCYRILGRVDAKESQEQKAMQCFLHQYGTAYLIMSYSS